jgi:hypothetical protein
MGIGARSEKLKEQDYDYFTSQDRLIMGEIVNLPKGNLPKRQSEHKMTKSLAEVFCKFTILGEMVNLQKVSLPESEIAKSQPIHEMTKMLGCF